MLPVGDINVIVVTDVHSWVSGHSPIHEPSLDADYGSVLSFYEHVRDSIGGDGNLFFVMNGDFMDGTGLTTNPPDFLLPILEHMPWSAVNIGNHELYANSTVQSIRRPGGFSDWWGGRYLTSNVVLASSDDPIGSRYTVMHGGDGQTKVLTFGFLYDMADAVATVTVQRVEDAVKSKWFRSALKEEYDAILVLAHMDHQDPLVQVILKAIRSAIGHTVPVQFITGHTHIRAYDNATDACSTSFEAGRYLDTVGFVSMSGKNSSCKFKHAFIDGNVEALRSAANVDKLDTDNGQALTDLIKETQGRLGLLDIVGCSPQTFSYVYDLNATDSFWRLYLDEIVPNSTIFSLGNATHKKILFQDTGAFRYDLFNGTVTMNDVDILSPFDDTFYQLSSGIPGHVIQSAYERISEEMKFMMNVEQPIPSAAMSPPRRPAANDTYDLYAGKFGIENVVKILSDELGFDVRPMELGNDLSTNSLIIDYMKENWACPSLVDDNHDTPKPSIPHHMPHVDVSGVAKIISNGLSTPVWIGVGVLYFAVVAGFLLFRSRKRVGRERFASENSQAELEPVSDAVFA